MHGPLNVKFKDRITSNQESKIHAPNKKMEIRIRDVATKSIALATTHNSKWMLQ